MASERIRAAIEHVRLFHPEVTRVAFDKNARWLYTDDEGNAPTFASVDVGILEDAEYDLDELPVAFAYDGKTLIRLEAKDGHN